MERGRASLVGRPHGGGDIHVAAVRQDGRARLRELPIIEDDVTTDCERREARVEGASFSSIFMEK